MEKKETFPNTITESESESKPNNSEEKKETTGAPTKCFRTVTKEEGNKWVVSDEMAPYTSKPRGAYTR